MKPPSTPGLPFTGGAASADPAPEARGPAQAPRAAARNGEAPGPRPPAAAGRRGAAPRFGRQIVIFVVLLLAALVGIAAVSGERGYLDVRRQKADLLRLRAEVASLQDENARLLAEVRGLRSDPFVIEGLARERLGYARPGEIIFQFPSRRPSVPDAPPPRAAP